jgi:hypothetical protein
MTSASCKNVISVVAVTALVFSLFLVDTHSLLLLWFVCVAGTLSLSIKLSLSNLTAVCIGLVVVGVLCMFGLVMGGHPVSLHWLARIKHGATAGDVERTLGRPSQVFADAGDTTWQYTGATWCIVEIHFDSHGKVQRVIHDH